MSQAILFVGHGTRNKTGQQQFLRLAESLRAAVAPLPLEVAYIEIQSPSIEEALLGLHARGLNNVSLSPALLFAAGHAKQDIPVAIAAAEAKCPGLVVTVAEPLGCHEALLELAAIRFQNSLAPVLRGEGRGDGPAPQMVAPSSTALVLVGRGSSDPAAIAHCQQFAQQLADRVGIANVFTGFIAVAQPNLQEALELAAANVPQRVIVQPHLLFSGEMLDTTAAALAKMQARFPQIEWLQSDSLAGDLLESRSAAAKLLVQSLRDRLSSLVGL